MQRLSQLFITTALLLAVVTPTVHAQKKQQKLNQPPEGFTALFSGQDITGWWGLGTEDPAKWMALPGPELAKKIEASQEDIKKHWRVEDGILINDGHGLYLTTLKNYGDFELLIDYRTVAKADSGIYLRGIPQVQIWDTTEEGGKWGIGADKGSGGLWNNPAGSAGKDPLELADKPFGHWNSFRIIMVGEYVTIWLNDKLVVNHARLNNYFSKGKTPLPRTGPIQLQTHGGEIAWRNIFIREIGAEEANSILRKGGPNGGGANGKALFNGKNLEGWAGAVDSYEVVDGAIQCKPGKGGTLYYDEQFKDFLVKMDINIPAGGNNGLAIRYPGSGDTAYVGMCELQVLDNTADKYKNLDPRQFHGSAYGMVAAHRGYLREPGQWNYQEVRVKGPTIHVTLNGFVILDADLSKVTEYMGGRPHPGKDNERGYFGFAGHGDAVKFRGVELAPMRSSAAE